MRDIWLIVAAIGLGPLIGALLMDRLKVGLVISITTLLVIGGALALVVNAQRLPLDVMAFGHADRAAIAPGVTPAPAQARPQAEHERLLARLAQLRQEIATAAAARKAAEDALRRSEAALAAEKAGHVKLHAEVAALRGRLARLEASMTNAGAAQPSRQTPADAQSDASSESRDLATGSVAVAEPRPLPSPLPFSATPPAALERPVPQVAETDGIAPEPPLQRALAAGMKTAAFSLALAEERELIEGQRGHYYRVACLSGSDRMTFGPGNFMPVGGAEKLRPCIQALRKAAIDALPPSTPVKVYVQGFASPARFLRPEPLAARDARFRTTDYLPRLAASTQFASTPRRQTTGDHYSNQELPVLRAAFVADWIGDVTGGKIKPVVLEGEHKSGRAAASRSFDIVLYVKW